MEGRDSAQLIYRWTKSVDPSLKKGPWTPEEDAVSSVSLELQGAKVEWLDGCMVLYTWALIVAQRNLKRIKMGSLQVKRA